jgi:hypothetical protein
VIELSINNSYGIKVIILISWELKSNSFYHLSNRDLFPLVVGPVLSTENLNLLPLVELDDLSLFEILES